MSVQLEKEPHTMGRVTVEATVENMADLIAVREGRRHTDEVRHVTIEDALVDTGATMLALPTDMIRELGLERLRERESMTARGPAMVGIYDVVRLHVQGRNCSVEVMEVPENTPALIGQVPLEIMDFVVDLQGRQLTGNPAHGGKEMLELL